MFNILNVGIIPIALNNNLGKWNKVVRTGRIRGPNLGFNPALTETPKLFLIKFSTVIFIK